ncbi:MAG: hypothetical protein RLZZ453_272 [Chlamydiota bacterium]
MINKLTGPFTGLISKIPGMASKKPVEVKTKRTALSCLKSCFTCAKKPKQVVVVPKPSMTTLAKKALNDSKQFAVGHKKALIGATAIGLAGAAGYPFRKTLTNMLSSRQPEIQTALSTNSYTLPLVVVGGAAIATYLSLALLSKKMLPGYPGYFGQYKSIR